MAIQLKIDRVLQGSFDLKALNLFVFQVNCPGCFIYGFPSSTSCTGSIVSPA